MKLQKALTQFQTAKLSSGRSKRTVDWYGWMVQPFLLWLENEGVDAVEDVTPEMVEEFLALRRAEGDKSKTVRGYYLALSSFFGWIASRKKGTVSPVAVVEPPEVEKSSPRRADLRDLADLVASIHVSTWMDLRDRLIVRLLFWTGLRIAEACALDIADVDLAAMAVKVRRGKGNKGRSVPLHPSLRVQVLEFLVNRPATTETALLLSAHGDGGPRGRLTPSGVRIMLKRRAEAAGITYWNPHSYRHAAAMELLNSGGMELGIVSKLLGHESPEITRQVYADWTDDSVQKAYKDAISKLPGI